MLLGISQLLYKKTGVITRQDQGDLILPFLLQWQLPAMIDRKIPIAESQDHRHALEKNVTGRHLS
jgi:hypothetical protein